MVTTRTLGRLALIATLAVGFACGDDDPTDPGPVTFPDWPSTITTDFCVRGTAVVGETKSGTLSDTDCHVGDINPGDVGYFEVWRIRVASARDVTFDANSAFDNLLVILRVNSATATNLDVEEIGGNDDRSGTDTNALVTVRLQPNVDYAVAVLGFDDTETGSYTLTIR